MSELEDRLRTMLRERAGDVTQVPEHVLALPAVRPHGNRRAAWLVAAAVAIVLALAAALVAVSGSRHRSTPAVTKPPTKTVSPAPPTHAVRQARLAWFGMNDVSGFEQRLRISDPGFRVLGLRARADQEAPVNCNGCAMVSDWVHVFDAAAFKADRYGVTGWSRTSVRGKIAYLGSMRVIGSQFATKVPTLAWQYRPDAWAVVQGVTPMGRPTSTLRAIARAARPAEDVPIELPFRLDFVPQSLPVTEVTDDRGEGYAFVLQFGTVTSKFSADVTLWPGRSLAGKFDTSHATRRTIGGLPGWYDPNQGFAVQYRDGVAVFGVSYNSDDTVGDHKLLAQRQAIAQLVLARLSRGIRWTNGDGRAPYVPAEQAIP